MLDKSFYEATFCKMLRLDVEVRLTVKTPGCDPTKREYYWMTTLKTLYPYGLNIESDY